MSKQLKRLFSLCSNEDKDHVEAPSAKIARIAEYLTREAEELAKTAEKDLAKRTKELAKTAKELAKVTCVKAMEERAQEAEDLAQTAEERAQEAEFRAHEIAKFRARAVWYRAEVDRLHQRTIILILQAEQRRITAWSQIQEKKKEGKYPEVRTYSICTDVCFMVLQQVLAFLEAEAKVAEDQQMLAYVTNCDGGDTISIIATANNTVIDTIFVGGQVDIVAIAPNGTKAYVTSDCGNSHYRGRNSVSIIATVSNTVMDTINVGENVHDLAITPDSTQVYIITRRTEERPLTHSPLLLLVFDIVRYGVIATIDLTKYLSSQQCRYDVASIAIAPDGTRAYVISDEGIVIVIATATNQVIDTISIGGSVVGIVITPDGKKLYVADAKGYVSVIATASYKVVTTIQVGRKLTGVAITPDGKKVYVANFDGDNYGSGTVSVIATADDKVIATIKVNGDPKKIAFTPDGKKAYVSHFQCGYISVIDIASDKVVTTIDYVDYPYGVAISRRPAW
jgi:YVTN family beta-propeller protein